MVHASHALVHRLELVPLLTAQTAVLINVKGVKSLLLSGWNTCLNSA